MRRVGIVIFIALDDTALVADKKSKLEKLVIEVEKVGKKKNKIKMNADTSEVATWCRGEELGNFHISLNKKVHKIIRGRGCELLRVLPIWTNYHWWGNVASAK